ncbi:MAG: bifunctional 4-hydroxy-2-oxoglutarate aldolase/2-dehydro-3-deoxy-phosphogluconate aldolase [Planctomycetota bacterium]|jgi:2-dehydro-3-deoxyphosphogluconate aldolase/(4S)-4-hydroxy-2-oxoglutarate aldolase
MDIKHTINTLLRDGFILVFNQDKLDIVKTAQALIDAGLNNMEVTCRISRPLKKIEKLCSTLPDFVVGAASLIDFPPMLKIYNQACSSDPLPGVEQVIETGVSYIVSAANFSDKSYTRYARRIAMIPGCGSVTEIVDQFSKGANLCKIFPAKQLGGPAFVKAIDPAIHKTISLVPTGGTNADNIPDYIDAGVLVLGGSFSMIDKAIMKEIIDRQDYDLLSEQLIRIKQLINNLRAKKWPDIDFAGASVDQIAKVTGRNFNL